MGNDRAGALLNHIRENRECRRKRSIPVWKHGLVAACTPAGVLWNMYDPLDIGAVEVDRGLRSEGVACRIAQDVPENRPLGIMECK